MLWKILLSTMMFGLTLSIAAVAAAEPVGSKPESKDDHECMCEAARHDAAAVAAAVLKAYQSKDLKAMAALATEGTAKICLELAEQGEKHPRHSSLFGGSRWEAVQAWDGKTLLVRYRDHGGHADAVVGFHKSGEDMVYVLLHEGKDGFQFDDVKKIEVAKFEQMSEKKPAESHGHDHKHDGAGH
jgi:hypothetical protein